MGSVGAINVPVYAFTVTFAVHVSVNPLVSWTVSVTVLSPISSHEKVLGVILRSTALQPLEIDDAIGFNDLEDAYEDTDDDLDSDESDTKQNNIQEDDEDDETKQNNIVEDDSEEDEDDETKQNNHEEVVFFDEI